MINSERYLNQNERRYQKSAEQIAQQQIESFRLQGNDIDFETEETSKIQVKIGQTELWLLNMSLPENQGLILEKQRSNETKKGLPLQANLRIDSDWLLVDFEEFDLEQKQGFKGVWDDRPVSIGRSNLPPRFEHLSNDRKISRNHLGILLEDGRISIQDFNSTNGTELTAIKKKHFGDDTHDKRANLVDATERQLNSELLEAGREIMKDKDMVEFAKFTDRYKAWIENTLENTDGGIRLLRDAIYGSFYSSSESSTKIKPVSERAKARYAENIERNRRSLDDGRQVNHISAGNGFWSYYRVNGGPNFRPGSPIGRLYLNLDMTACPDIQAQIVETCRSGNIPIDIKSPAEMIDRSAARLDKMVVYFNEAVFEDVKSIVEQIYNQNKRDFLNGTPRFAAEVLDAKGNPIRGVAFGEEPVIANESFGGVRSAILADLCLYLHESGKKLDFSNSETVRCFKELCDEKGIDYRNLSRNKNSRFSSDSLGR